jgi:hypothetical protein
MKNSMSWNFTNSDSTEIYDFFVRWEGSGTAPCQEEWKMCGKERRIVMLM